METIISKKQATGTLSSLKRVNSSNGRLRHTTLEEYLEKQPFIRKKHERAVANLERYPVPEELLMKINCK